MPVMLNYKIHYHKNNNAYKDSRKLLTTNNYCSVLFNILQKTSIGNMQT